EGRPTICDGSRTYLGDSVHVLNVLRQRLPGKAALVFTSPPYFRVTNYHYDQWLRLWLLGEAPNDDRKPGAHRAKFEGARVNASLLPRCVFASRSDCKPQGDNLCTNESRGDNVQDYT